jgi:hypothetical protein
MPSKNLFERMIGCHNFRTIAMPSILGHITSDDTFSDLFTAFWKSTNHIAKHSELENIFTKPGEQWQSGEQRKDNHMNHGGMRM